MGCARKRVGRDGKIRYTATYVDVRGSIRSAGTFASERAANKAWQSAEAELRQGRVGDPARGRQTFRRYVQEQWLPNHVLEPTTREKYTYYLGEPSRAAMRAAHSWPGVNALAGMRMNRPSLQRSNLTTKPEPTPVDLHQIPDATTDPSPFAQKTWGLRAVSRWPWRFI
jgi:hypothetical protein